MTAEIAQRREVGHAVSAPDLWEEGPDDPSWSARFLTTHLTAWHLMPIVKEVNTRPRNCLVYNAQPLLPPVSFRFAANEDRSLSAMR